jgi:hypothetical protein
MIEEFENDSIRTLPVQYGSFIESGSAHFEFELIRADVRKSD